MQHRALETRAFSLVELSIVLVILGLLVGGILSGQSLIRAAELRSLVTDMTRFRAATQTFRDKYFALPGDMTNATSFWGSAGGTGADTACYDALTASSPTVCNGNGDGQIEFATGIAYAERFYYFKELSNAGLIEGSYTGRTNGADGTVASSAGINVPRLRISSSVALTPSYLSAVSGNAELYDGSYGFNTLYVYAGTPPLKPEEAWNIDTKLDDGLPATGRVFTGKSTGTWSPGCTTTDVVATAQYKLTSTTQLCNVWFVNQ